MASSIENYLVITAVGRNSPTLIPALTRVISDCGCSIGDSRLTVMGDVLCVQMMLSGSWDAIAKVENMLQRQEQKLGINVMANRTTRPDHSSNLMPYAIDVVGLDQPGIVHNIVNFIVNNNIQIEDIHTHTYKTGYSLTIMFSLHMTINIPADLSIASIRGDFMDYCDQHNLDAIMEPVK